MSDKVMKVQRYGVQCKRTSRLFTITDKSNTRTIVQLSFFPPHYTEAVWTNLETKSKTRASLSIEVSYLLDTIRALDFRCRVFITFSFKPLMKNSHSFLVHWGPINSRTRTNTKFDCPFAAKILRKLTTWKINLPLCQQYKLLIYSYQLLVTESFLLIKKCHNCDRVPDLFCHDNIFAKPKLKWRGYHIFPAEITPVLRSLNAVLRENLLPLVVLVLESKVLYRWFSRYVIGAMLVDENKRFLISSFCSSTSNIVHCSIVICVPRDWLQTSYSQNCTSRRLTRTQLNHIKWIISDVEMELLTAFLILIQMIRSLIWLII